jgi:hypothetical protein
VDAGLSITALQAGTGRRLLIRPRLFLCLPFLLLSPALTSTDAMLCGRFGFGAAVLQHVLRMRFGPAIREQRAQFQRVGDLR